MKMTFLAEYAEYSVVCHKLDEGSNKNALTVEVPDQLAQRFLCARQAFDAACDDMRRFVLENVPEKDREYYGLTGHCRYE